MKAKSNSFSISVGLIVFCLGCLVLVYAFFCVKNLEIFPWQIERYFRLLITTGIWFWFIAAIILLSALGWRRDSLTINTNSQRARKNARVLFVIFILLFCVADGWLSIVRHQRFNSTGYDLAINEQIVWNTLHGRFFASSPEVDNSFADHFRPFLMVIIPFYAIFQSPITLLVLQIMVLAAGAIPLYRLAILKLANPTLSVVICAVYLLYPALGYIGRFDFHIEVFVIPSFIAAFYAMEKRNWNWASVWLLVPLLCKENMGLTVAAFGLYAFLVSKKRAFGICWILVGLITFTTTSFWLIPTIRGESSDTFSRYSWMGDSPAQLVTNAVFKPGMFLRQLFSGSRILYLFQLLLPVGFIVLFGLGEFIPAIPGLALNMLADHHCQSTIYCQYTAPIIPFVFVSLIFGLNRIKKIGLSNCARQIVGIALVPLAFVSWTIDNPFTESMGVPDALTEIGNADVVRRALQTVPAGGSLVTTNDYAPHLAQREGLYILGRPAQRKTPTDPDIVFLNLYDQEYIVCEKYFKYLSKLDQDQYGVIFRTGGLIVIQKAAGSNDAFKDFLLNWNNCAG